MRHSRLILLTLLAASPVGRALADSPVAIPPKAGWQIAWHDEFDAADLDQTKWGYRYLGPRESALVSKDSVSLDGQGHLLLMVKEQDGKLLNGMIGTQGKFSTTYGLFEARIKFPRMQGQHGSFWMQPDKGRRVADNPALSGAEIDIIEWFGAGRKDGGTASNVYWPGPNGPKDHHAGGTKDFHSLLKGSHSEWSDDFHIFSLEWSQDEYVFAIDDHVTYKIQEGVSQTPQYMILSLLTADWEKDRLDRAQLPSSMIIDWVRVWKKK